VSMPETVMQTPERQTCPLPQAGEQVSSTQKPPLQVCGDAQPPSTQGLGTGATQTCERQTWPLAQGGSHESSLQNPETHERPDLHGFELPQGSV
jgi:hypothetical protein